MDNKRLKKLKKSYLLAPALLAGLVSFNYATYAEEVTASEPVMDDIVLAPASGEEVDTASDDVLEITPTAEQTASEIDVESVQETVLEETVAPVTSVVQTEEVVLAAASAKEEEASQEVLPESGTYSFEGRYGVKAEPKVTDPTLALYKDGSSVNYDSVIEADGRLWISYTNYNGGRSYIAVDELEGAQKDTRSASQGNYEAINRVIYLDAGHGGADPGAVYGVTEKELNLAIQQQLKARLEALGYQVVLTRTGDSYMDLIDRSKKANGTNSDLFISIHFNASTSTAANGIETYYYGSNPSYPAQLNAYHLDADRDERSAFLASAIHQGTVGQTAAKDNGVHQRTFAVLRETVAPSVLLELGYMSNPAERAKITQVSYQRQLVNGIVKGIEAYYQEYDKKASIQPRTDAVIGAANSNSPISTPVARVSYNGNYYTVQGKYGEIVLVNKQHPVNASYAPGENAEAKQAFNNLKTAMQSQGYAISNNYSGYRSYQHQANLYNNYVAQHGQAQADRFSARPGYSEHQTGLAYDLLSSNGSLVNDSRAVNWIKTNAHRYGFIVRYPEGKESVTGFMYEPWHLRYIGKEATDIYQSGKTLEEYFGVKGGTTYGVASYETAPNATPTQEGVHTFTVRTAVKSEPTVASPVLAIYEPGQTVRYDSRVTNDGYEWLSYINYGGGRSYVAVKKATTETTSPEQSLTLVTKKTNAKVEVLDYAESKTDFTVKVTGQADTEAIKNVRVAVWSQDKGQDDLKWYQPAITNNQSSVKVDISNHSNTSDKYIVHVYTTYANGQMVGTNLGSYQITKPGDVVKKSNAKVEVLDYAENKTDFTVKVTGQADTEAIKDVRVAVWSQDKGQDDLKWYQPAVSNNQSSVKVDISNHSNTSDKYVVHVYTTYANGQTVGTNLGSYQITKPGDVVKNSNAKIEVLDYAENKTDFTVKVTGQADTEAIKHVRVAVWSQDKGQDDLKWYQPAITNNQSSVKVDISNHSNTSDKYIVHVYTTYANGQTVGTDLGSYQITKPVAATKQNNARVEVLDYAESKTDFTVKVTGQADTEAIKHVRVAVWSQDKGQDDLKWYQPAITNNQSSVKVDISNHSNTSDKYIVHVYTTYANGQTVGTDLGSYQIIKPVVATKQNNAKVEVLDYAESKTDFTVKVTGQADTEAIKHVRVAVWSQDKGQDDLKWYQPAITNNQSSVKVDISNHSNTSDKYIVHVYTTYANGQTVGTDLGSYQITKPAYTEYNKSHGGKTFRVLGNHNPSNAIMNAVVNAINEVERQGYSLGFKLTDAKTGEGIAYNANTKFYSASTIKAPYVAALAANRPATINSEYYNMKAIAEWSSNEGYAYLRNTYGAGPIYNWADKSGVSRSTIDPLYPYLTPNELHALWKTNYEYFNGSANGNQVGSLFTNPNLSPIKATVGTTTKTQSKAGWIAGWGYHAANDGGIVYTNKGDYVISIMSNADGKVGLLNSLVRSLNNLYNGLK